MSEVSPAPGGGPKWRPLERYERRAIGVLAEKAKTTPDAYPLTLNALVNGCNQKSNRFPQMQLDEEHVSEAMDSLRRAGAASLVQGDGRAEKYRHLLYDWLGVDKAELAVMTELLLRGAQTIGELRGRAARMEPIAGMAELAPIVESLVQKGLLIYLTPPGRGAVVTHNLYQPQELAKLQAEHGGVAAASASSTQPSPAAAAQVSPARPAPPAATMPVAAASRHQTDDQLQSLRDQVETLIREIRELREDASARIACLERDLQNLRSQLGA